MTQTTYIKRINTYYSHYFGTVYNFSVLRCSEYCKYSTRIHFICNTHNTSMDSDLRASRCLVSRYAGILCVFYSVLRPKH